MWPPATEVVVALIGLVGVVFTGTMGYLGTRRANARAIQATQRADRAEQQAVAIAQNVELPAKEFVQAVYRMEGALNALAGVVREGFQDTRREIDAIKHWQVKHIAERHTRRRKAA